MVEGLFLKRLLVEGGLKVQGFRALGTVFLKRVHTLNPTT